MKVGPNEIIGLIRPLFDDIFNPVLEYRATGACLFKLKPQGSLQLDLFGEALQIEKFRKIFESVDTIRRKYGKHSVCLGSSYLAISVLTIWLKEEIYRKEINPFFPEKLRERDWVSLCF
jgi:hypothetical protein